MNSGILITGASGMLGASLQKIFPTATTLAGKKQLDLSNMEESREWFLKKRFKTIIHCAALTNLNQCQRNSTMAFSLHSGIIPLLNDHCDRLIYISTVPVWQSADIEDNVYFISKKA